MTPVSDTDVPPINKDIEYMVFNTPRYTLRLKNTGELVSNGYDGPYYAKSIAILTLDYNNRSATVFK